MRLKDNIIFILSPESWGISFVSKHHYAVELAKLGNQVFFINPPNQNAKNAIQDIPEYPGLKVVDYQSRFRGLNRLPAFLRNLLNNLEAKRILKLCGLKPDIFWSFDPFRFQNFKGFGAKLNIYHPVDPHQTKLERICAANSDIIFTVSHKILDTLKGYGRLSFQVNHGLAPHFLEHPDSIATKLDNSSVHVGYVGNLNYALLDIEILETIIKSNPEVQFHFIGPYKKNNLSNAEGHLSFWEKMLKEKNVKLYGPVPSSELPALINQFDLFLMCYKTNINPLTVSNSHKILEYLSTGKIVISHFVDEYKDKSDLIKMATNNTDLPVLFSKTLTELETLNSSRLQKIRQDFAKANTYPKQLERIENILEEHV